MSPLPLDGAFNPDGTLTITGAKAPGVVPFDPLRGGRSTSYRFELLDSDENILGEMNSVQPKGGFIEWHAYASVKAGGSIPLLDRGQDIDFLNDRIRITTILSDPAGDQTPVEVPLGVYLVAAPLEAWSGTGRRWDVEIADKCSILDQDIYTDPNGNPKSFVAQAGTNVIETVLALIAETGEPAPAIEPSDVVLPQPLVWEPADTLLKIANDLLQAAGFAALSVDRRGQFRTTPFVQLQDRPVLYDVRVPFQYGEGSLRSPVWSRERDIYSVPNRYVAVSQGSGDEPAMIEVATNMNPDSPFSYPNRGRWISTVTDGVEAADRSALRSFAERGLAASSGITSGISTTHLFLPDMEPGSIVQFTNIRDNTDVRAHTTVLKVPLEAIALCSSDLREVVMS